MFPAWTPASRYELNRANGTRLDVTKTLDELGVEDGATLVLVPAQEGESFEPQYESLSTGLARVGKRLFAPVTAETAAHTAMAVLAMVALSVLGLALHTRLHTDSLIPAVVTGVVGLLLAVGAGCDLAVVARSAPICSADSAGWPSRCWRSASPPRLPATSGAAHVFIAALATAVLTVGCGHDDAAGT